MGDVHGVSILASGHRRKLPTLASHGRNNKIGAVATNWVCIILILRITILNGVTCRPRLNGVPPGLLPLPPALVSRSFLQGGLHQWAKEFTEQPGEKCPQFVARRITLLFDLSEKKQRRRLLEVRRVNIEELCVRMCVCFKKQLPEVGPRPILVDEDIASRLANLLQATSMHTEEGVD